MTLADTMRALLGDGSVLGDSVREFDVLMAADAAAVDIQSVYGVLYSNELAGATGAEAAIERLAREHTDDPDLDSMLAKLNGGDQIVQWGNSAAPLSDVLRWYAQPHMRCAYYVGLAAGWRAARQTGGAQ